MKNKKINLCIVFGGKNAEHEVSINSARSIYEAVNKDKYNISLLGISKQGKMSFLDNKELQKIEKVKDIELSQATAEREEINWLSTLENITNSYNKDENIDVFFPIIHGTYGEDGALQGFFEMLDVAYIGAGVVGSAIGMDKDVMKRLLRDAGINVANFVVLKKDSILIKIQMEEIIRDLKLPVFVKPASLGSSIGVSKVHDKQDLIDAIKLAFEYDKKVIIEEFIDSREIEVAILGNDNPIASIPGEIVTKYEFYTYEAKYIDENGAMLDIPAKLSKEKILEIQNLAIKVFKLLECSGLARVDFFLKENGEVFVNEINTLPGFTNTSMYPKLWEASGISFSELIDQLVGLAIEKKTQKDLLKRIIYKNKYYARF